MLELKDIETQVFKRKDCFFIVKYKITYVTA